MANSARYSQSAISITSYLHRPTTRDVHLKARRRAANQGAQAEKYARSPEQADQDAATASESASFCRCQKFSARLSEVLHTRLMRPRGGRQVQLLPALRLPPSRVKLLVDLLARLRLAREISVLTRRVLGCHNRRILIKQLPRKRNWLVITNGIRPNGPDVGASALLATAGAHRFASKPLQKALRPAAGAPRRLRLAVMRSAPSLADARLHG